MLTNIYSFDPEMILHSHFHFKSFPEKEREREREREKREPRSERKRGRRDFAGDRTARRSCRSSIDKRARRTIAPLVGRSHRSSINERARNCDREGRDRQACRSRPSSIAIASALIDRRAARSTSSAIVRRARSSITPLVE